MSRFDEWALTRRRFIGTAVSAGTGVVGIGAGLQLASGNVSAEPLRDRRWGLLANPGMEMTPVKGVYFFPGEGLDPQKWTTHPLDDGDERRHLHWNSGDRNTRAWVLDRIADAHANTIVASWWHNPAVSPATPISCCSPMKLDENTWPKLITAVQARDPIAQPPLRILPAIESDPNPGHSWRFQDEFPRFEPGGLVELIGWLCDMFSGDRRWLWAQLYDRNGTPRYAVNILHACSNNARNDAEFADGFNTVARAVKEKYHIDIGFTLDTIPNSEGYSASPGGAGPALAATAPVLAIHGFESEIFSGVPHEGDNNRDNNIANMAAWKRDAMNDWINKGPPVILDVSNGYDARYVFPKQHWYWGDNQDHTDDRWRNWMSQLKNPRIAGICVDCWNGYTEGYATVRSKEHGDTVYNWLRDLLEPDPRGFNHMHYVNNVATHRVYGAIGEKWMQQGADRFFGAPITDEEPSGAGRKQEFTEGKSIYWGPQTGAWELHGLIAQTYRNIGGGDSCLGLPLSDEQRWTPPSGGSGSINYFQNGQITWQSGTATTVIRDKNGGYMECLGRVRQR
jgi:hypothetical protein